MKRVTETRLPGLTPVDHLLRQLLITGLLGSTMFANLTYAQTPAAPNLPDGSRDSYLALGWANEADCQLGGESRNRAKAYWQFQWSNGAFIRNTSLGWHLSEQDGVEYGPLLEYLPACDWSVFEKGRQTTRSRSSSALGGFFNYAVAENWRFNSKLLLQTDSAKSKRLNLEIRRYFKPSLHQALSLGLGYSYQQRAYSQDGSRFEPEMMSGSIGVSAGGEFGAQREYKINNAGLDDNRQIYLNLNWNWELNPSWMMMSSVSVARNLGDTGIGVQQGHRYSHTVFSGIAYRF